MKRYSMDISKETKDSFYPTTCGVYKSLVETLEKYKERLSFYKEINSQEYIKRYKKLIKETENSIKVLDYLYDIVVPKEVN